jgi:hypothetical protein
MPSATGLGLDGLSTTRDGPPMITPTEGAHVELQMGTSEKAHDFLELIIRELLLRFPIARAEAVGRINQAWGHLVHIGDANLIFHETAQYRAKTIYYGEGLAVVAR